MDIAAFLSRLQRVTKSGDGWSASCPAHDDRDPSLSVAVKNEKILVYCHANPPCEIRTICAAMGIEQSDLFIDNPFTGHRLDEPIATYTYVDEWGSLLYQKLRYRTPNGKTFRVRRRDPATGQWVWNLHGTRRVLYRLPELLAAINAGVPVYVVDGEKDADTLWSKGYAATTSPLGAGSNKWRPEYAEVLARAREVIVVADKEEGGLEQAQTVAASLEGKTIVRIVEARTGKDVSDHIQAGHSVEQLAPINELASLLDRIKAFVRRYHAHDDEQGDAIALWVAHNWAIDAAFTTPYLHVTSAEEESGKTRLLEVLELLLPEPIFTANISEAALYRLIQQRLNEHDQETPTLLIDEIDAIFSPKKNDAESKSFRSLLNSGYRRGQKVYRAPQNGSTKNAIEQYEVFSPKIFAGIGNLPRTLASRCIRIESKRRAYDEPVEDFIYEDAQSEAERLKTELRTWRASSVEDLRARKPERIPSLRDRGQEVWRALLSISLSSSPLWEERARQAAVTLSQQTEEPSLGILLLEDVRTIMVEHQIDRILTTVLAEELFAFEESPWAEWWEDDKGNKKAPRGIGKLLRPYGILTTTVRTDAGRGKGYKAESFLDSWKRLLPPLDDPLVSVPEMLFSDDNGDTSVSMRDQASLFGDTGTDVSVTSVTEKGWD